MKDYLVNVPVRMNIWIREECQKKQFEVIKNARPSILFVQSDGGRTEKEWEIINKNRKMIEEGIDWNCKVYKIYADSNQGLYKMSQRTHKVIWENVDRCILLEDDQIPAVSYFKFCEELLEKYKNDERIECICGMNHLEEYDDCTSDYFFSRQGSIWGIAIWKRVVEKWYTFDYGSDKYIMKLLSQRTRNNRISWKRIIGYSKSEKYEGHVAAPEFFIEFDMYAQNRLQIIPKVNMISNIGATGDSEHAAEINQLPRGIRKVFNMPIHELSFPMKHPKYVIPDVHYEKKRNRIMGYNYRIISLFRKIERFLLMLKNGQFKTIYKKILTRNDEK